MAGECVGRTDSVNDSQTDSQECKQFVADDISSHSLKIAKRRKEGKINYHFRRQKKKKKRFVDKKAFCHPLLNRIFCLGDESMTEC